MSPRSSKNCSNKMKRSLITLLLLALCCLAQGQESRLKSGPVLQGEVIPESRLVETLVKGLGEDAGIAAAFVEHLKAALK